MLSNSLSFPINENIELLKERITILTTSRDDTKIQRLRKKGIKVVKCRGKNVSAKKLNQYIITKTYKAVYFIAGPTIVEQMICENLLDKLYYSTSICIMGSKNYDKLIRGKILNKSRGLKLIEMYIHTNKNSKLKQQTLFQVFNLKEK